MCGAGHGCRVRVLLTLVSASTRTSLCGPDMNAFAHQAHTALQLTPSFPHTPRSSLCVVVHACYLEACKRCLCPLRLVWHHAADDAPQDAGRSAVVPRTSCGVGVSALADERSIFHCRRQHRRHEQAMYESEPLIGRGGGGATGCTIQLNRSRDSRIQGLRPGARRWTQAGIARDPLICLPRAPPSSSPSPLCHWASCVDRLWQCGA